MGVPSDKNEFFASLRPGGVVGGVVLCSCTPLLCSGMLCSPLLCSGMLGGWFFFVFFVFFKGRRGSVVWVLFLGWLGWLVVGRRQTSKEFISGTPDIFILRSSGIAQKLPSNSQKL